MLADLEALCELSIYREMLKPSMQVSAKSTCADPYPTKMLISLEDTQAIEVSAFVQSEDTGHYHKMLLASGKCRQRKHSSRMGRDGCHRPVVRQVAATNYAAKSVASMLA